MKKHIITLGVAALVIGAAAAARAQALDADTLARFDKGPAFINVSKYPTAIQGRYKIFEHTCSKCHRLSRPINSDFATPDEWSRYIKRMMYKPGSGISRSNAKKIYEFLVYDASVRKKALLDSKLEKMPAKQKAVEEKKIAQVHKEFDDQ
jgi:cytochrome c5